MNYERFKKIVICLALTCVFALPVAATFTSPVYAQGRYRRYDRDHDRWERRRERENWRRLRHYRSPNVRRYDRDRYGRFGYYDRFGRFHRIVYYR